MIPKVTKGTRLRGLLEYLWGPGKSDEHVNPRIVAGYDDPAVLAPPPRPDDPDRCDLAGLAARLDAPHEALGERGLKEYVLQVSLSVRPDERTISDAEWGRIARSYVDRMGLSGSEGRAGCRWIAVHHGRSINGNDHIHLVVTRATEDGAPVYLRNEWGRSQDVCDEIEQEFGLRQDTPGRAGTTRRPAASRWEVEEARQAGRGATDRELLRREVRAALAGAVDEQDWVGRMKAVGLLVAARRDRRDPHLAVGYVVALPPRRRAGARARWLRGRDLDGDLSLTRVRQRWPGGRRLSPDQWKATPPRDRVELGGPQRIEVWRATAAALDEVTRKLRGVPPNSPQWPAIAWTCADTLTATAVLAEPDGFGPVSRAADILARAAAPKRVLPGPDDSALARELRRISDAMLFAGAGRHAREAPVLLTVVVAAARLIVALAGLRDAQHELHAAGATRVAAERMMPLLHQAQRATTAGPVTTGAPAATRDTVRPAGPPAAHRATGHGR